jgi:phage-related minor tail protein
MEEKVVAAVSEGEKALQKFDQINADLAELETRYMVIVVQGPNDKDGFDMAHKARMDVSTRRVGFVKDAEKMRADAVRFQKLVIEKVKPVEARAKKIEAYLQEQEDIVNNEKARIKAESDAKEAARIQARRDRLAAMGVGFNGQMWAFQTITIPDAIVRASTGDQFEEFVSTIQLAKDEEDAKRRAEEAARKAESERIAKIAADQEAERQRLAEITRKQEEDARVQKAEMEAKEKEIRDAQEAIEKGKQRLIDEENARLMEIADAQRREVEAKLRAEELEKARKEAAEKAVRDAEAKRLKDEADRIEKERLAKIAAEKKAARAPDKEKLLAWVASFNVANIPEPFLKTQEAKEIFRIAKEYIESALQDAQDKAEAL